MLIASERLIAIKIKSASSLDHYFFLWGLNRDKIVRSGTFL